MKEQAAASCLCVCVCNRHKIVCLKSELAQASPTTFSPFSSEHEEKKDVKRDELGSTRRRTNKRSKKRTNELKADDEIKRKFCSQPTIDLLRVRATNTQSERHLV